MSPFEYSSTFFDHMRNTVSISNHVRTTRSRFDQVRDLEQVSNKFESTRYYSISLDLIRDTLYTSHNLMRITYEPFEQLRYTRDHLEQIRSSSNLRRITFPRIGSRIVIIGPSYRPPASDGTCIKTRTMKYFAYLKDMRSYFD